MRRKRRRIRGGGRWCVVGSSSVSRGGGSRSGGGPALSWRDRTTREGEGQTGREETHRTRDHKHTHTTRGMGGKKGKIKIRE